MTRTLSEAASKAMLASAGVPVTAERVVTSADDAAAAAAAIGYPVVVKLCGDRIAHKTERGLVRLGLGDGAAVRAAATDVLAAARPEDGDVAVLVAAMVAGSRELIAGVTVDPQLGPCVMVGVGGVLAEAVADVSFRMVPLDRVDADEMIDDLRAHALLGPWRGEAAVARERLVDVLLALSDLVSADPAVVAIDVNPLVIARDGVPIAVDALIEVGA